jgi:hypothetical protein
MKSLTEIFGERFRIRLDETWEHALNENRDKNRIWFEEIPLVKDTGFIYLYSLKKPVTLACYTTRVQLANAIHQEFKDTKLTRLEGESVLYFQAKDALKIARRLKARVKRQMSEEQKEIIRQRFSQLIESGKIVYKKGIKGARKSQEDANIEPDCHIQKKRVGKHG